MSVSDRYFRYLKHFGKTSTLSEAHKDRASENIVSLRHDIDHDLDIALDMALEEHKRGIRATYFLLHTAPYWKDPLFAEKCLELQSMGHEVGLHLNIISEWFRGKADDIGKTLENILLPLSERGVRITGVSAHGDRLCYEKGFINHWCFSELRPDNPEEAEAGLNAEGIKASDGLSAIKYPPTHALKRSDGREFHLWSVSMQKLGLEYLASRVPFDSYFTDSGGSWSRTHDPIERDLSKGRHQVLIHPIHWQGRQRIYFFLSPDAHSAEIMDRLLKTATPLKTRSHYILGRKLSHSKAIRLRASIDESAGDYAEAGTADAGTAKILISAFPDAVLLGVSGRRSAGISGNKIFLGDMLSDADNPYKILSSRNIPVLPELSRLWQERMKNGSGLNSSGESSAIEEALSHPSLKAGSKGIIASYFCKHASEPELKADFALCPDVGFTLKNMRIIGEGGFLTLKPEGRGDSHMVMGGGYWRCLPPSMGWRSEIGQYYAGKLEYELRGSGAGNLFLLSYCPLGRLISARLMGRLYRGGGMLEFMFKVRADAARFCIGLKTPASGGLEMIILRKLSLGKAG